MKDSGSLLRGGRLLAEYASCWAEYIVRYLLEYRKQGVEISAVTIQNEPHAVQTWESCQYTAEEEAEFAVRHLRPTLDRNGLSDVGIILWDHNKERLYQRACDSLSVPGAAQAVWGIGFHWYSGSHFDGIALTAAAFPEKKLIATEFCLGGREGLEVTVDDALRYARELAGDLKSGACACVDWNVLLDEKGGPYHDRGFGCKAPVIYDKIRKALHYTPIFNAIGHFSRFIERGAVSIGASVFREDLLQAAVRNPDGKVVLVLANTAAEDYAVNIRLPEETAEISICGKSMLTVVME
jgi:glucosylceramidase